MAQAFSARRFSVNHQTLVLILSFVAFISLGLPDAVLGVAWPSLRGTFDLPRSSLGFVLFAGGLGYFTSSLLTGTIIARLGVGRLLVFSTALVTGGLLGYALSPVFPVFLVFSVGIGFGSGAIDSALNVFATEHFSDAVMSRLHGFFGVGALFGPVIMGTLLDLGATWRWGYVVVASILFGMLVVFVATRRLWDEGSHPATHEEGIQRTVPVKAVLAHPVVWMNIALFFLIVGVEMTGGQWAFTVMRERFGLSQAVAGLWAGCFWGALAFGRLTFGTLSSRVGAARMVQYSSAIVVVGGALYTLDSAPVAIAGLLLVGLSLSTIFPLLMSLTPRRIGRAASAHAVGFQVSAAVLGGAVVPWIAGWLSSRTSLTTIGWVIVMAALCFFAIHGVMMRGDDHSKTVERSRVKHASP